MNLFIALPLHAQLYEQSVKEIIEALSADSLERAEVLILQTTRLDPMRESNGVLYRYLGGIYQRQGQCEKALDAYSKGIGLLPGADLLLDRASLYLQMNDLERAGADYSSVLELSPDDEEALFFRAYVFSSLRRYREARADYERLLELNPQHEDGRLGLALLNNKDGRPREAMEQLDALV
ncbi:MAG: tetratricopeptide repeat protein, partial [Bacteroidaceae bacterium]|nr:tetratricopeptide repeat protein [Bacteroidaceae bacterium]